MKLLQSFAVKNILVSVHCFSMDTMESSATVHCRDFAPAVGIPERVGYRYGFRGYRRVFGFKRTCGHKAACNQNYMRTGLRYETAINNSCGNRR